MKIRLKSIWRLACLLLVLFCLAPKAFAAEDASIKSPLEKILNPTAPSPPKSAQPKADDSSAKSGPAVSPAPAAQTANKPTAPMVAETATPSEAAVLAPMLEKIEKGKELYDQVIASLRRQSLDDAVLQDLRKQLSDAGAEEQAVITELTPRLEQLKTRLEQLGPAPAANAPPENQTITLDRAQQQKHFNDTDEALKRAKLLAVQIEQTDANIASRRRVIFINALYQHSYSILSPALWAAVMAEIPIALRAAKTVAQDFLALLTTRLHGFRLPLYLSLVLLIALLNIPLYRAVNRILSREPTTSAPSTLDKALAACWVSVVVAVAPIATVFALFTVSDMFDLSSNRFAPLRAAILQAALRVALTAGLARGLLAPSTPSWRLLPISDEAASRLGRLAIVTASLVSFVKIIDSINEIIGASAPLTAATQGVGAFALAILAGMSLYGLGEVDPVDADGNDSETQAKTTSNARWIGLLRMFVWFVLSVNIAAVLLGFIPFAAFLIDQVVWDEIVIAATCILVPLITETIQAIFKPTTPLGRALISGMGVHREGLAQFSIVLTGVSRILIYIIAFALVVAPWGVGSNDFSASLRNAYFGFEVNGVTISPSSIVGGIILFVGGYGLTRALQNWLDQSFLPATHLDSGLRNSIKTSVGYLGFVIAASIGLAHIGFGIEKLAIVAGALSVGIGFGLQSIVNNFVSGLILLWERAIRVGDWVIVGEDQGHVVRINVRSTEIVTFDRATMIVPNSNLVTGVVKNWVRSDRVGRIKIPVTIALGADPETVRALMVSVAKQHDQVEKIPAPQTLFVAMDTSGLKFELVCFVADVDTSVRVRSDLNYAVYAAFVEAGVALATSTTSVQIGLDADSTERLAQAVHAMQDAVEPALDKTKRDASQSGVESKAL